MFFIIFIFVLLFMSFGFLIRVVLFVILMTFFLFFGGMMATSWVQIINTIFLLTCTFLFFLTVLSKFNWNVFKLIDDVKFGTPLGDQFFVPGQLFSSPLEVLSLYLALILGTAGLPHILIRFYTVDRKSVV